MDELLKIIITSSLTIVGGVIVFVLGQIAVKFYIEPLADFKKFLGEIEADLFYYATVTRSPINKPVMPKDMDAELRAEAYTVLRQKQSMLLSKYHAVNGSKFFGKRGVIPNNRKILIITNNIIRLHNYLYDEKVTKKELETLELFILKNLDDEWRDLQGL